MLSSYIRRSSVTDRPVRTRTAALALACAAAAAVGVVPAVASAATPARGYATVDHASYATGRVNISDSWHRTVAKGLGGAPRGGHYATSPVRKFSVKGGAAQLASLRPGTSARATLNSLRVSDEIARLTFALKKRPARGGVWVEIETRRQSNGAAYRARLKVSRNGRLALDLTQSGPHRERTLTRTAVLHSRLAPNKRLHLEAYVTGSGRTAVTLKARAWKSGARKPAWQVGTQRREPGRIAQTGTVGIRTYASRTNSAPIVRLYSLTGWALHRTTSAAGRSKTAPGRKASPVKGTPTKTTPAGATTSTAPPTTPAPDPTTPTTPITPTTPTTPPTPGTTAPSSTTPAPPTTTPTPTTPGTTTPPTPPNPGTSPAASFPGPSNTGVPSSTVLRQYDGDLFITTPGAVYDGLDIHGFVYVRAANVTIRNSIVRGGVATKDLGLVNVDQRSTGFQILDSELVPEHPSVWLDGIKGWNYAATRVNIHGTVDGAKAYGNNVLIQSSWIHDTRYYLSDPNQGGGPTHNDGIQILSGANLVFRDNTIEGGSNAAVQVTQGHGVVQDLTLEGNLISGGACSVNIATKPLTGMSNVTMRDNRFVKNSQYNCAMIIDRTVRYTSVDNMFADAKNLANVIFRG